MNRRTFMQSGSAGLLALHTLPLLAQSGSAGKAYTEAPLFGVDYYPDQTPEHLWVEDARQMQAFGVTNVRIAEFAWSLMEPSQGTFAFAWLDRAVSILHAHGIGVILGTPSAAPPPWLSQKYPEILEVDDKGMTLAPGTRRFTCPTNKTYRGLSVAIATQMAQHYAHTPGVIGWQIDNELTLGNSQRCYCRFCQAGFQAWLQTRYASLKELNDAYGNVFWSNVYTDWSQIPVPLPSGAPPNPGLALDYNRYQSYANVSFLGEQLAVLRRLCPDHFLTTNNVSLVDSIDMRDLYRGLDFVSSDNYPGFFGLQGFESTGKVMAPNAIAALVAFSLDFSRSVKDGKPFFIMEQQSGKAGQPTFSPQPMPGQLRLWSFQTLAHGAMGLNYFRWDTATAGAEEYWHGLLRHDRSPSPGFDEMRRTFVEMKQLGMEALHAGYPAGIGLCFDYSSDWALTIQPGQPQLKYLTEVATWYGLLNSMQAGVDIIDPARDLSAYQLVCAPALYVVSPAQAASIRAFVQQGGTFISGVRLGVKTETSRIVETPLPGLLRDVMGVELFDYQPIYDAVQTVQFTGALAGPEATCHIWADILTPHGAEALATYAGGACAGKAAITVNHFGKGRAIYVGAGLQPQDLARVLFTLAGIRPAMQAPPGVEVATRRSGSRSWTYLLNHTAEPQNVNAGMQCRDLLSGTEFTGAIPLEPYGVRVLMQA